MSEEKKLYKYYYQKAKRLFNDGQYQECINILQKAFEINPSEELQIKINKVERLIEQDTTEDRQFKPDENKLLIEDKYYVNKKNFDKLYGYQKEGVIWLFKTFESKKGCILADDMGLGKTVQMIFYLRELFESDLIQTALIIMPKSLLINWEREIKVWAPSIQLLTYFGNDRERNLLRISKKGGILLSTYGTVMHSWDELRIKWGVVALDEGHKIKNPSSKTFKTVNSLKADIRVVMTGTAVQNNLKELWALFDFTHQGSLLGSYPTFNREYEKPITDSRKKDATQHEKLYGDQIALSLKKLIKPYFLRRTKEEVSKEVGGNQSKISVPKMTHKNELVIWLSMTEAQIDFYKKFLEVDEMKIRLLRTEKRSPLLELNILKKICDHPRLLSSDQCVELGLPYASTLDSLSIELLVAESGKMVFVLHLIKNLADSGHKCLLFSQSKRILTFIQRILLTEHIPFLRLDGDVLRAEDRQELVDRFNTDPRFKVMLLTSQVGGVGLTLTGADRVIIYDLNWNPSVDAQAVDRVYRIGQVKNVVVYRLITCGTVEEKIYRRQIFKDSLNRQTTGIAKVDDNSYRYFTQNELFELFNLGDPYKSDTQIQLNEMHSKQRRNDPVLSEHMDWLQQQGIFGISDHDLLFTQEDAVINVDKETKDKLIETMQQAERLLIMDAKTKETPEEQHIRELLSNMTINTKKSGRPKESVPRENMFIPSKTDLRRPMPNMVTSNSTNQTQLDPWLFSNNKRSNFIDLTTSNVVEGSTDGINHPDNDRLTSVTRKRQSDQGAANFVEIDSGSSESSDDDSSTDSEQIEREPRNDFPSQSGFEQFENKIDMNLANEIHDEPMNSGSLLIGGESDSKSLSEKSARSEADDGDMLSETDSEEEVAQCSDELEGYISEVREGDLSPQATKLMRMRIMDDSEDESDSLLSESPLSPAEKTAENAFDAESASIDRPLQDESLEYSILESSQTAAESITSEQKLLMDKINTTVNESEESSNESAEMPEKRLIKKINTAIDETESFDDSAHVSEKLLAEEVNTEINEAENCSDDSSEVSEHKLLEKEEINSTIDEQEESFDDSTHVSEKLLEEEEINTTIESADMLDETASSVDYDDIN